MLRYVREVVGSGGKQSGRGGGGGRMCESSQLLVVIKDFIFVKAKPDFVLSKSKTLGSDELVFASMNRPAIRAEWGARADRMIWMQFFSFSSSICGTFTFRTIYTVTRWEAERERCTFSGDWARLAAV
jgi:hypothetical protein